MERSAMIALLTTKTGETDSDILSAYLDDAADIVLKRLYPFGTDQTEIPETYQRIQIDIAAFLINKMGAEGEKYHSENGVTRTYEDGDVPPALLRRIVPKVGVL
jgi:phosphosulfolactate synthase (CoM biosynthesis protein A)